MDELLQKVNIVSMFVGAERGLQVSVVCIAMGEGSVWFIKYIQVRRTTAATHLSLPDNTLLCGQMLGFCRWKQYRLREVCPMPP